MNIWCCLLGPRHRQHQRHQGSWCGERRFVVRRGFRGGVTAELRSATTAEARGATTAALRGAATAEARGAATAALRGVKVVVSGAKVVVLVWRLVDQNGKGSWCGGVEACRLVVR